MFFQQIVLNMALPRLVQIILLLFVIYHRFVTPKKCTNPMPSLMKMASGVDITNLDLYPLGDPIKNRGFVENVFNFTCSGKTFGNSDYIFDFPDQIKNIEFINTETFGGEEISFMSDLTSVKRSLLGRLGLQFGYESSFGAFSRSSKYTSLLKQHFESSMTFSDIETVLSSIRAFIETTDFMSNSVRQSILSHDFAEFITHKLPLNYEDNPSAYQTFVQRFGTHYFERVTLSDYSYVQFALNRDYAFDTRDRQISDNIRVAYFDHFKRWDTIIQSYISNDLVDRNVFENMSKIVLAYSALKNGSQWVDKLTGTMYVSKQFNGLSIRRAVLKPIELLIDNPTIQAQVSISVRMHRIRAQLDELTNIYKFCRDFYQLSNEEKASFENVSKLVHSGDIKQIDQMVSIISKLYNKVLLSRDQLFYDPVIYDMRVTASVKLEFAKQICAFSMSRLLRGKIVQQCPSDDIQNGQRNVSELYEAYRRLQSTSPTNYSEFLQNFEKWRKLNLENGLRADITKGLKASCGDC